MAYSPVNGHPEGFLAKSMHDIERFTWACGLPEWIVRRRIPNLGHVAEVLNGAMDLELGKHSAWCSRFFHRLCSSTVRYTTELGL